MENPAIPLSSHAAVAAGKSCWLCLGPAVQETQGIAFGALTPDHFAITDSHYGTTLGIYRCQSCGFRFCPDAGDVTSLYADLEDEEYERTRAQRSVQARYLLATLKAHKSSGKLLDIGAGSGILVEEAERAGFDAQGVEPSQWLVQQARNKNIPVLQGVFPQAVEGIQYDVIALIDVLEHVTQPLKLLQDIGRHLKQDGVALIVTPDGQSVAAKAMGKKWWHYRIAHISYFDKKTLTLALANAGLEPLSWCRPTWYFPLDYLLSRLGQYLPGVGRLASARVTKSINVPLNLFDSWLVVPRKAS